MVVRVKVRVCATNEHVIALVDDIDAEAVNARSWRLHRNGYAVATMRLKKGRPERVPLHQFILGKFGVPIDHANLDKLDNRRENLRFCSDAENNRNRARRSDSGQPFKGIELHFGKWRARVVSGGKRHTSSGYATPESAAMEYDHMARQFHGDFAFLNFPEGD